MKPRIVTATPTAWSPSGCAVAFSDRGRPLDIWSGIVGESCRVKVTHQGMNRAMGYFLEPTGKPHRHRRKGDGPTFHISGSSPLMHLTEKGQHQAKLMMIREALATGGFESFTPDSMIASPDGEFGYRHVVKLVYGRSERGSLRLGAYARGTNRIVTISDSMVVTPVLRECIAGVAQRIIGADIWPYDPDTGRGLLRHVVMRQSRSTGHVLVTLVATRSDNRLREVAEMIQFELASVVGVQLHMNEQPGNAIFGRDEEGEIKTRSLVGKPRIEDKIGNHLLGIGGGDFFQVNPGVANLICTELLAEFASERERPVLDLYCGVGAFTMSLAEQHGWALGVEVVQGAITRARESARKNHVSASFVAGAVADVLPTALERVAGKAPLLVLNPSRKGLEPEVGRRVLACEPLRIAYVSCNPKALARDLVEICARGWRIDSIRAFDMLPQTAHVELLAMLSPIRSPEPSGRAPRRKVVRGS
ncbi:MAG: 23S rRNA (uracil(1939)-C(5))-methyltransferase RlmD [Deltaproteobacteria bacterium]|nr:23S rRNA (uracil(1939)-C(5))-methyltransferase RlmD [Deltaproteobacteria bacterium]HCH66431.1 23S rRNA (uracil(1939)-C(5))-methyltransferase RlmD [Deltaproteobacteria bacterium]